MPIDLLIVVLSGFLLWSIFEWIYRSLEHHRFVFPRFINVQIYVLTGIFLYVLSLVQLPLVLKMLLIVIFSTLLEYLTGYLYLKYKKIRLRDYSHQRANYKRLICPLFSFYRLAIALVYYFFVLPWLVSIF